MVIAQGELGTREYTVLRPGPGGLLSNPRIEEYQAAAHGREDDEVPWCSSFVCWVLAQVKLPHTSSGAGRSWMRRGPTIALAKPRVGCIVPLWREALASYKGHVGFLVREDENNVWLLGGNQGNAVTIKPFPKRRVLGFRWPTSAPL